MTGGTAQPVTALATTVMCMVDSSVVDLELLPGSGSSKK